MDLDQQQFRRVQIIALILVATGVVLAGLVYGRGFLVPLVIALFSTGLVAAAITRLERFGAPTWLAMICSIGAVFLGIGLIIFIVYDQTGAIAEAWPRYQNRFTTIVADLAALVGPRIATMVEEAVAGYDFASDLSAIASSAGDLLGTFGLIVMYSAFLLAERGQATAKFANLFPDPDESAEVLALFQSISLGIRRYMWIKSVMSITTGVLSYIILKIFGVDFAEILGVLVFALNFIPSIGSIVAVIIPAILTLIQFDTIGPFLQIVPLLAAVQFVIGNIVEPRYMGKSLNLSTFVVLVSLTFWGTVWGLVGMFLSVPIAASIVIICRDIPSLRWIAILMSSDGRPEAATEDTPQQSAPSAAADAGEAAERKPTRAEEIEAMRQELEGSRDSPPRKTRWS